MKLIYAVYLHTTMKDSLFTIIIPTFNHEETLRYSINSILQQTVKDFTVHVIGDGAGKKTARIVNAFCRKDPRIRYHAFPKSPRTGEVYRAQLLAHNASKYICYLSDDDLWFPDHLEVMQSLLEKADFAYSFPLMIRPNGSVDTWYGDFTQPFYRKIFLHPENTRYCVIPFSSAGHRLTSYRQLSHGWETTPAGKSTDLHMWQAFVAQPGVKLLKSPHPTTLNFPSSLRENVSVNDRVKELKVYAEKLEHDDHLREQLLEQALTTVYDNFLEFRIAMQSTKSWRLLEAIRNLISINR